MHGVIAAIGAVVVAMALFGAGVLWGLVRLGRMAVGLVERGITSRLGPQLGQAGAVGIGWGISRFAGRFATPLVVWAAVLALGAAVVGALTWETPQTVIGIGAGLVAAVGVARGLPRVIERMIKRRLAKGLLHR